VKLPDLKQVRQIRLLPVVILAACALFALKGFGLVTTGGYVLTGPSPVFAAGDAGAAGAGANGEATMAMPAEPTLIDANPTLDDGAPTLPLREAAGAGHEEGDAEEGDAAVGAPGEAAEVAAAEGGAGGAPADAHTAEDGSKVAAAGACPPAGEGVGGADPAAAENCVPAPAANEHGDALPLMSDGTGNRVPVGASGSDSENAILERLADRREELAAREEELEIRMALVEAAERRIEERTAVLEALEARINAMVDEKRTLEESQFVAVVAMYETMKPKDAAAILDQLEMSVLLRVARGINPRKMAPIMAKMNPAKAMELTAGLAVDQVEPTIEMTAEDLTALPQIVGQ
jgi:flagellar motility protein MotE (MotC chaperone)